LAATDKGLFRSDTRNFLAVGSASAFDGLKCVGMGVRGGVVYALGENGYVYRRREGMEFEKYPDDIQFSGAASIAVHQSGLYVAGLDGIYRCSSFSEQPEYDLEMPYPADFVAVADMFGGRLVFAAKDDIVYYYSVPPKFCSFSIGEGFTVLQVVP